MKMLIDALNILIWKMPMAFGCDTVNDTASFIVAELADKGIEGIRWRDSAQQFEEAR